MSMTAQDRQAIESVFDRLKQVESQGAPRDAEAEQYIQERLRAQPGAAYYMAQTVLIQEQALQKAQERMQSLEKQAPAKSSSLSDGGFGRQSVPGIGTRLGGQQAGAAAPQASNLSGAGFGRGAGGGFLAGALQTAVGVAGGLMLGNMLTGLFTGNDAQAGELPPEGEAAADEAGTQEGHGDVDPAGYDDGGMGGFDDGGGFDDI